MKKVQANNFDQAIKELKALDETQVSKVVEQINENESKHFHVLLIQIIDRPGQPKNQIKVVPQIFNKVAFEKIEKNFGYLGYNKIIVVHNPTNQIGEAVEVETKVESGVQMKQEEINAEIEKRANEKAEQMVQEKLAKNEGNIVGDTIAPKTEKVVPNPFENGETIEAMKAFAKANDIDLSGLKAKDEIKATLITWKNEQESSQE
ncbi:hypothetical protein HWC99_gp42 [Flavobacterium phage vB_FspS_tant8-1]|uniref:Uncharacterized protein n=1 Tax=Flavobacterium phage vB_FspS_tant8-1 TaxID=2686278 RepID=A0A6B9LIY8_9CAUD|nr:hypothetical protein HWC99_gp42 [Flavobacterium phage vB_FspS_tant8-1]QHB40973.1 hypothetical protein tant81_gp042 [Flavobacterium phage vB_FspS_tant8-1]